MPKFVYKEGDNHLKYFNKGLLHKNIIVNDNIAEEIQIEDNINDDEELSKNNKKKKK